MEIFCKGLNVHTRTVVDASGNGTLLDKSYNEAFEILEKIVNNNYQYPTTRVGMGKKAAEVGDNHGKNLEATDKHITLEKGKQLNVVVKLDHVANKNVTTKKYQQSNGRPPLPFSQQFHNPKQDVQFKRFLDVLKELHINITPVEALENTPNYVKFMKDILSRKSKLGEFETVALTEGCTIMLMNKLTSTLKAPRSFTIPCSIGNHYVGNALCDLGVSANLMLMSIFRKLGIEKTRPTIDTLQLADRSYAHPEECEANQDVPIILGRPFLATEYHTIGLIETTVEEEFEKFCNNNSDSDEDSLEWSDTVIFEDIGELMKAKQFVDRLGKKFESLNLSDHSFNPPKPSIWETTTLF
ncbi:uncharacterized protein LOC108475177 [Gossypium arboreum]|uniref:uncharacterized protein LOC108475177 n=1 Tax=Gossypium arboreum TaxID=29729 RepID=UPI0008192763|nr:uncharacterized protein LOC108475177 [Gossypium arboreum]